MNSEKVKEIFDELLRDYDDAESCVIGEFSTNGEVAYENLEKRLADYRKRFHEALNDGTIMTSF